MKGQKWHYLLIKDNTEDAVACIESNLPIKADKLCTEVIHLNGYHAISISKEEYLQWQEENQGSEEAAIKWNSKVDSTIAEKR
jgi:hypothetical protein